ncbi:MAG: mechanosensitive ion channel family protein [Cytophagales bacterium]
MDDKLLKRNFWESILDDGFNWMLEKGPEILLTVVIFTISYQLLRIILRRIQKVISKRVQKSTTSAESEKRARTLMDILRGTLKVAFWVLFIFILLKEIGLDIAPLLAGAGILGLAVGFGAQELVRDVISGFFMLFEDQIRTGDVAIINGVAGAVEKIELRTVTLRDMQGTVHIFQNGKINSLSNMTKEWSAAVFDIGVSYDSKIPEVIKIMEQVGAELKNDENFKSLIIEAIEIFGLNTFADSALIVKARLKTKPGEQWKVMREFNKRLKDEFDKKGIEIPFPQRTIHHIGQSK